jgi:VanZ family protein
MASLAGGGPRQNGWPRRIWLWLPPIIYMAVIFYLSAEADPFPMLTQNVWDKAIHCLEYGGLALLLCRAMLGEGIAWAGALTLALVLTSAYGASDEWHQLYTPGRASDYHDWIADTVGAAVGLVSYVVISRAGYSLI